ncbi:hypothetical protein [Streptomyces alboflavus]|uniref:hypothetical protein n=1 Tax=Streptomyces alboflavus TaxID=67267 RepID=UPI0004C12760|nr:hypothetical protein [Streptomyces alboflavus]
MLEQALVVLAEAGGTAVVQAAGTDTWTGLRQAVARWFGRGNSEREQAELERLDRTAGELEVAGTTVAERVRIRQEAAWQARIESLLENLDAAERARAAADLRALLTRHTGQGSASSGPGGLAVSGSMDIRTDGGSVGVGVLNGDVHIDRPQVPDPSQG